MIVNHSQKKINIVVSCGCSWVAGIGCYNKHYNRLSKLFATYFKAKDINLAKSGGSNGRTERKIVDWIVKNKDKLDETFFLIGITEFHRYEVWYKEYGRRDDDPYSTEGFDLKMGIEATLRSIILLVSLFEKYNCKYLIFDSIDDIKVLVEKNSCDYFDEVFSNKNYYTKQSWMDFCSPRGKGLFSAEDNRLTKIDGGDWRHPSIKSNKLWYETLLRYYEDLDVSK